MDFVWQHLEMGEESSNYLQKNNLVGRLVGIDKGLWTLGAT